MRPHSFLTVMNLGRSLECVEKILLICYRETLVFQECKVITGESEGSVEQNVL